LSREDFRREDFGIAIDLKVTCNLVLRAMIFKAKPAAAL
jgi:hypothetical protein